MSKEFIISSTRHETRVAILEDDQVVEVYHQRENEYSLAGSIHKGRVTRVLPGMQSAFVDIGLDRDAFLYVSDFFEDNEEYDKIVSSVEEKVLKLERGPLPSGTQGTPAPEPAAAETAAGPVEAQPAEIAEPDGFPPGPAAPMAAEPPAGAPVAVAAEAPTEQPRRHDERGDWDRDRRGRRSRRRRGQKGGGRGLPDSKYFSPGPGGPAPGPGPGGSAPGGGTGDAPTSTPRSHSQEPRPEVRVEPVGNLTGPVAPVTEPEPQADDFFVLPGESLAKYADAPADWEEPVAEAEEEPVSEVEDEPVAEAATEAATEAAAEQPAESEPVAATASEPAAPLPETAAVDAVTAAPVEAETTAEPDEAAEPGPSVEAAAVVAEAVIEEPAAEEMMAEETEADTDEAPEGEAPLEGEALVEPLVDPEGPEPARIPTSLTATLREQGPRFLHRVSRRMRRRGGRDGREGRDNREGRDVRGRGPQPTGEPEGGRPPLAEARGVERTVSAAPRPGGDVKPEKSSSPSISDLLREGQEIIVQIAKEPLGQKGARITSHIALPGRFLVYMPTVDHIGVSRKIPSDDERMRLKRVLQNNRAGISGGFIVRTAGEGRSEEELRADMMFLYNMWLDMRQKAERRPAPVLIHHDLNVVERVLRDQLTPAFKSIWVDTEEAYEAVLQFVERFQPALVNRVKLYTRSTPIFDEFGITAELEKALRPKVWLKSGGYIVINQTEALVAIDVNTGKYVGKSNRLEDTIVKTNTDAIKEIVRQIRLRDLGGIVVVDFIDMDERKNRQKVMQALEEAMRADRAPYKILQFNDFGLVAITRKRVKQSLERTLCTPCPYCEAAGYVKSPLTMVGEILQEAQKLAKVMEGKDALLRVSPEVAKLLKSNQNSYLQEIEEVLRRPVIVKSDAQLHQDKFDLA